MDLKQRFRGATLGLAIGDALGMPVEGMSCEEIRTRFGRVDDFMPSSYANAGEWTDDTEQMTILAESIIETTYLNPENFARRLRNMKKRTGPTTKKALQNLAKLPWNKAGIYADTCGAAMRVAPIGLVYHFSFSLVERYAVISSIVTHRGDGAIGGAVAIATALACICSNFSFEELFKEVIYRTKEYNELIADKIQCAFNDETEKLETSMFSWDAVPTAFYCFFSSSTYEECVLKAVNIGGDTDSIAAMAGGMKGAEVGINRIPERWVNKVKDCEYLIELADRLYNVYLRIVD
jgi:ADP-ribosylglycohydrolase